MNKLRMLLEHWGLCAPSVSMLKQLKTLRFTFALTLFTLSGISLQAQISVRVLEREETSTDAFSFSSGNYTPKAGSVLLAVVTNSNGNASNANSYAEPSSASGNGLTWTSVSSSLYAGNNRRLTVFRAFVGTNVVDGAFTVNFPGTGNGQKRRSATIQIIELLGVELSGTNASEAIHSLNTGSGNNSTATVAVPGTIDFAGTSMLGIFATDKGNFEGDTETGWSTLATTEASGEDISTRVSYALNTYDVSARMTNMDGNWAGIAIRLAPAEFFYNFPVVSTTPASNNLTFNMWGNGIVSRNGNASNLTLNMSVPAATFVAKGGNLSFGNVNISSGANVIVDQSAVVSFPAGAMLNSGSNMFVANGGTFNTPVHLHSMAAATCVFMVQLPSMEISPLMTILSCLSVVLAVWW